eukprot:3513876-Rhodomonas_salina.1
MRELVGQMEAIGAVDPALKDPRGDILGLDRAVTTVMTADSFPTDNFGAPLAGPPPLSLRGAHGRAGWRA